MIEAATTTENNRGGNGRFGALTRKRKSNKKQADKKATYAMDSRMRFNNSKDPIYAAFDALNNRSIPQLAGDFIADTFFEISNFVSKVVK